LLATWDRVRAERRAESVTLLSPPGMGKSRLLHEFGERLENGTSFHWGRCLPYGEGITYWPVAEILKGAAGILHDDDSAATSLKLGGLLQRLPTSDRDELRTIAAALANLVGAPTTPEGTYTAAEITQAELHWGIRRLLELLATERPLVLVIEDLHWAERTLFELLESIVGTDSAPILVLGSARPELVDAYPALATTRPRRHVIELAALGEHLSGTLLAELVGGEPPQDALLALLENAGGNPLFLEEIVGMLTDAGLLVGGRVTGDIGAMPVPTSLQALIGARLDQLSPGEKRVAQHASVVGGTFWLGALRHLDGAGQDLVDSLDTLARRDFVRAHAASTVAGEREFSFKHALIREVAYGQLPKGRRADLHLRFADWVEALPGSADDLVEIVAYHLEQACLAARAIARSPVAPPVARAVTALNRAAGKSERRQGYREAERYYTRALAVVGEEDEELVLETSLRRATSLAALGELTKGAEELAAVAKRARTLARDDLRAAALVELGDIDQRQGRAAAGRGRLDEARRLAADQGDRFWQIRAEFVLAGLRADFDGKFEDAVTDLRRSITLAEEIDDRSLRAEGHLRITALLVNLGRFAEAEQELLLCLDLAGDMGSHRIEAEATSWLSIVKRYRGALEEAETLALQAEEWLERTGDSYFRVQNLVRLAMYALEDDDPRLAQRWLEEAVPVALVMEGWLVVEVYRFLVEALVRLGRTDDARELADFAARGISDEDAYARATVLLAQGIVSAAEGATRTVRLAFEEALMLLEDLHMPVEVAEARVAFARAMMGAGEPGLARAHLARAREIFTAMSAEGALSRIAREPVSV
jgi:tetratricopeptide (TPR) repeat protein